MKTIVDAKPFSDALANACTVPRKSRIPCLNEVYVHAYPDKCILAATDLTTWFITEIPAQGDEFSFIFSRSCVAEKASRYFCGELVMEYDVLENEKRPRSRLTMRNGARTCEFEASSGEDYPDLPNEDGAPLFSVQAGRLMDRIKRTGYAAEKPSAHARPIGSCIQFSGNSIFALDGRRMAWDTDESLTAPREFGLQLDFLAHLKVFGEARVDFLWGAHYLQVTDGRTHLFSQHRELSVFNFQGAIPQRYAEQFTVSPKEFLRELTYLKGLLPKRAKPYVYFHNDTLTALASGEKYRTAISISGETDLTVGFDLVYMMDALKQFSGKPRVTVKFGGGMSPIVVGAENRSDHALVLPVWVKSDADVA